VIPCKRHSKGWQFGLYNARKNARGRPTQAGAEPREVIVAEVAENGYIPLTVLFRVIGKRLWVILCVAVMLAGATFAFGFVQTPQYEAFIKILVGQERGITETPSDSLGLQQLTLTMAEAVSTRPVAEAVIRQQDLQMKPEALLAELSAEQMPNTQFIEVSYKDPNPERAQRVVNSVGQEFSEQVSNVSSSTNSITATVWEPAVTPNEPVSPNPVRNALLALALGLMLGVGLAFLLEYLDDTWRSAEEVEQISGVPTLGAIPEVKVARGRKREYQNGPVLSEN
jgi:capsular polysaccharide biosynthesis protein